MDERRCAAANCTSRELPTQICPICKAEGIVEGAFFCDKVSQERDQIVQASILEHVRLHHKIVQVGILEHARLHQRILKCATYRACTDDGRAEVLQGSMARAQEATPAQGGAYPYNGVDCPWSNCHPGKLEVATKLSTYLKSPTGGDRAQWPCLGASR
jgi:hypothetical protein